MARRAVPYLLLQSLLKLCFITVLYCDVGLHNVVITIQKSVTQ